MISMTKSNPPMDEPLMVKYDNYECVGYLDDQGTWREWFSNRELKNVVEWIRLE